MFINGRTLVSSSFFAAFLPYANHTFFVVHFDCNQLSQKLVVYDLERRSVPCYYIPPRITIVLKDDRLLSYGNDMSDEFRYWRETLDSQVW